MNDAFSIFYIFFKNDKYVNLSDIYNL